MASRIELQPLITVTGDTTSGDVTIVQPLDLWASIGNWGAAIFTSAVSHLSVASGDTVDLGFATMASKAGAQRPVPDGPAGDVAVFPLNIVSMPQWYKTIVVLQQTGTITNPAEMPFEDQLFWVLTVKQGGTPGPFAITFDISATLKWPV